MLWTLSRKRKFFLENQKKTEKYIPFALTLSLDELQVWPNGNPEKKGLLYQKFWLKEHLHKQKFPKTHIN